MIKDTIDSFLNSLPPTFNKDARESKAISILHIGGTNVECVVDGATLTLKPVGLFRKDQEINLANKTITQTAADINATGNYVATVIDHGDIGALRLVDGTFTSGILYVFDNINYAIAKAFAMELDLLQLAISESFRQTIIQSSTGAILDYYGSFVGLERLAAENDDAFAQRILDAIRQTRANNKSIEISLASMFSIETIVNDCKPIIDDEMIIWNPLQVAPDIIGDITHPLYDVDELDLPCTFSVNFVDWFITAMELSYVRRIATKVSRDKAAGTTYLFRTNDIGGAMLMCCPFTPIVETNLLEMYTLYDGLKDYDGGAIANPVRRNFWLGMEDRGSLITSEEYYITLLPADNLLLYYTWEDERFQPIVDENGDELIINIETEMLESLVADRRDYDRFLAGNLYVWERNLLK